MQSKIFSTPDGYEAIVFDEGKMIPAPEFSRVYRWHALTPILPRGPQESEADYHARVEAAAAELKAYLENIRAESIRLYQAAFDKPERVEVEV